MQSGLVAEQSDRSRSKLWIAGVVVAIALAAWGAVAMFRAKPAPQVVVATKPAPPDPDQSESDPVDAPTKLLTPPRPSAPPMPAGAVAGFQGAGALVGVAPEIAGPPYQLRWKYKAGDGENRASIANSPTIAGNTVYVPDSIGLLHAIDLSTGARKWQYKSEGGFETAPLVYEGRLYLGDMDGLFHCVDAEMGKKIWAFDTGSGIHASANLAPAPAGEGKVLIFGNDGADIIALSLDGKKAWEAKGGDRINASPALAMGPPGANPTPSVYGDGVALFSGCDARLLAVDVVTGKESWSVDLGAPIPGSPAVLSDRIVLGTGEGDVLCLDAATRKELWRYSEVNQGGSVFYSSPAVDVNAGLVVIGCRDRQVHAIDLKTGKRAWAFVTRGDVDASPVISGGRVYVGSQDKNFYVLDLKTGKKLYEFKARRGIDAGAAIGGGTIVFGDSAGNVYCLEPTAN